MSKLSSTASGLAISQEMLTDVLQKMKKENLKTISLEKLVSLLNSTTFNPKIIATESFSGTENPFVSGSSSGDVNSEFSGLIFFILVHY